ncbi:MAG: macro domain-containing protein [Pseudomonadota bacterium]
MNYECVHADISQQADIDAVVNAANAELKPGGGVAGAIHRAAGPELEKATRSLAPIEPGEAVITDAFNLPNRYIIHCLGPVYGVDTPSDKLLADCYRNALDLTDKHQIESIAFPALSAGAFGYPFEDATKVALDTIRPHVEKLSHLKLVRFVLFSDEEFAHYQRALRK